MCRSSRGLTGLFTNLCALLFLAGLTACGSFASYRLPLSAYQAPATFAPLAACASAQSLTAIEHSTSVNVRFDPTTWIQYMIQGDQYNMVIIVNNDVPPDQRPARTSAAKTKGDELWACAMSHGLAMAPAVTVVINPPPAAPPAPPVRTSAPGQ